MIHGPLIALSATVDWVTTIQQKQLRNEVGDVLRRAEAGEEFTITVAGRPVAQIVPLRRNTGCQLRSCRICLSCRRTRR